MAYLQEDDGAKKHAPATLRNRAPLLAVLRNALTEWGTVLEIASGSGEHAVFFAGNMPQLAWQPSDPDPQAVASIAAYRAEYQGVNLREPIALDATTPDSWSINQTDAIVCINMVHISPWKATEGLFKGAERLLKLSNGPVILYGPYLEEGVETAQSNLDFDQSLKARNPEWGLRKLEDVADVASRRGFALAERCEMPANNLMLVFRPLL